MVYYWLVLLVANRGLAGDTELVQIGAVRGSCVERELSYQKANNWVLCHLYAQIQWLQSSADKHAGKRHKGIKESKRTICLNSGCGALRLLLLLIGAYARHHSRKFAWMWETFPRLLFYTSRDKM